MSIAITHYVHSSLYAFNIYIIQVLEYNLEDTSKAHNDTFTKRPCTNPDIDMILQRSDICQKVKRLDDLIQIPFQNIENTS